ncbi:hypothetical protein LCGC14_2971880 [marine sediment metagenome]|uniref:Uncharacterized protein n=1 Tax=marine sediment metagenome TaxID=412755 RepID=A0A0F8XA31_9ZZZZ
MSYISEHKPILETEHTKIWQVDSKGHEFTVGYWLVFAPWAHLAWQYHAISLTHLRGLANGKPPNIVLPGATHELLIFALDPKHDIDPYNLRTLEPISIAQQFISENDAKALSILEKCIQRIADGELSPDSDFRKVWHHILVDGCPAL